MKYLIPVLVLFSTISFSQRPGAAVLNKAEKKLAKGKYIKVIELTSKPSLYNDIYCGQGAQIRRNHITELRTKAFIELNELDSARATLASTTRAVFCPDDILFLYFKTYELEYGTDTFRTELEKGMNLVWFEDSGFKWDLMIHIPIANYADTLIYKPGLKQNRAIHLEEKLDEKRLIWAAQFKQTTYYQYLFN